MRFSIIVPIYNIEKYVVKCIDSILSQTYDDFELILVDDGSTDNSGKICDEYSQKDKRIKVIHKENGGIVSARKSGVIVASGDYVVPVDGDDWISPKLLERANSTLQNNDDIEIFCYDYYLAFENRNEERHNWLKSGKYDKSKLENEVYPNLLRNIKGQYFPPNEWGKIYKIDLYKKFQLAANDNIKIGEDESVICPCTYAANCIYIVEDCLYYYRQNPLSMTKERKGYPWTDISVRLHLYRETFPLDQFDFKNQIDRWTVHALYKTAESHLRTRNSYKKIKKDILLHFDDILYSDAIKNCKFKKNFKEKLATFAVRHRAVWMIAIYAKLVK